ncbi:MAG TPA: histidine kinase dimerization/phosphoacceptor domain -containing protein, partial [Rectinemataceae bacterium]|nr:histidine kinase dimerization/phosphoacceptor domain -containing protein [Rectinemataceae bacterium]
ESREAMRITLCRACAFALLILGGGAAFLSAESVFTGRNGALVLRSFLLLESELSERSHLDLSEATPGVIRYGGGHLPADPGIMKPMYTFATEFRVDPALRGSDLALYMGLAEYPYRLYLNGTEIFSAGRYRGGHYNSSLRAVSSVPLSPDLLHFGAERNSLVLEAYPHHERWGLDRLFVDRRAAVDKAVFLRNFVGINLIQGAFVLVLIIGLYFLALYFFNRRGKPTYLVFSFMCAAFCLSYFNVTVYFDADNEVLLEALSKGGLVIMSALMLVFCSEFSAVLDRKHVFPLAVLVLGLAAAVFIMTRQSKEAILEYFGYAMNFIIVPELLAGLGILLFALLARKRRFVIPMLASFPVVGITAGSDVLAFNRATLPYAWLTAYGYVAVVGAIFATLVREQGEVAASNVLLRAELEERRRADAIQARLSASEQQYRDLVEKAADGVFTLDDQGAFLTVNDELCQMLGYTREELLGMYIMDTYPDGQRGDGVERTERINAGERLRFERLMKRRDGSLFPVEISAGRLPDGTHQAIARDISARRADEERLRVSLAEKEVLLREVHHRVKNNLQVISSMVSLQESSYRDEQDKELNRDTQVRIRSMAHLHELLYSSDNLSSIDIAEYLHTIAAELSTTFPDNAATVSVEADRDNLAIDEAMPLGLIATELVSNALKYAYSAGHPGVILVSYRRVGESARFEVRDLGVGMSAAPGPSGTKLGFTLVTALAQQIGAALEMGASRPDPAFPGLSVVLTIPRPDRGTA